MKFFLGTLVGFAATMGERVLDLPFAEWLGVQGCSPFTGK